MSGLIWAGIGKGIADAGQSFASAGMKQLEMDRQDEREALREQRLLERQEALDRLKADREEVKAEALKQRVITETEAVGTKAAEIGAAREVAQGEKDIKGLINRQSQIAGSSPAASEEEIKKLIEENPQYKDIYRAAGYIDKEPTANQKRLQRAEDESAAALQIGAHSSVIDAYSKKRKDVLEQIREENKEERERRRDDRADEREARRDAEFKALLPIRQQQADASTTKAGAAVTNANKPPSGGADPNKPATTADLSRQVTAAKNILANELGVPSKDIEAEIKTIRKRADAGNAGAKATLERLNPMLTEYNEANQRMLNFKRASPESKSGDNRRGESSTSSSAVARPTTKAEFDKLPSGATYVNPADGLTYRKK